MQFYILPLPPSAPPQGAYDVGFCPSQPPTLPLQVCVSGEAERNITSHQTQVSGQRLSGRPPTLLAITMNNDVTDNDDDD